jgi:hypothetical protein
MLVSCNTKVSAEDKRYLNELNQRFGARYIFELREDVYLIARARTADPSHLDEATSMYGVFWAIGPRSVPRSTSYVYLNLYDRTGTFQFQVFLDPHEKILRRSTTEFY